MTLMSFKFLPDQQVSCQFDRLSVLSLAVLPSFLSLTGVTGFAYFTPPENGPTCSADEAKHVPLQLKHRGKSMANKKGTRSLIFAGLLGFVPLSLIACGPSVVTQADSDRAKSQLSAMEQQKKSTEEDVALIIGARKVAPPPPKPKPAVPPPPAHTTPAFYYEPVGPFFFYVETLTSNGPSRYGVMSTVPCVQSGVFKRGMRLVFRYEILDTATGKRVTDKDGATTKVRLQHGE